MGLTTPRCKLICREIPLNRDDTSLIPAIAATITDWLDFSSCSEALLIGATTNGDVTRNERNKWRTARYVNCRLSVAARLIQQEPKMKFSVL